MDKLRNEDIRKALDEIETAGHKVHERLSKKFFVNVFPTKTRVTNTQ